MSVFDPYAELAKCDKAQWLYDAALAMGSISQATHCPPDKDPTKCWTTTPVDEVATVLCPFQFCDDCPVNVSDRVATRECFYNETSGLAEWGEYNYDWCKYIYHARVECIQRRCMHNCPDWFREVITDLTLGLSVVSLIMLVICLILFLSFRSLRCMRMSIHINLAAAFCLRFASWIPWLSLHKVQFFAGCTGADEEQMQPLCKFILFMIMFSTLASTWWMFVEGIYLSSRLSTLAMRSEGSLPLFLALGWGVAACFTLFWAILMEVDNQTEYCWLPYSKSYHRWLLVIPTVLALVVNFLILLVVLGILIQKIWADNVQEDRKLWKTIKATLLLVPLLGLPNLLLFYEPENQNSVEFFIYMFFVAILQHSQGVLIAFFYCFLNSEMQAAIKRFVRTRFSYSQSSFLTTTTGITSSLHIPFKFASRSRRPVMSKPPEHLVLANINTAEALQETLTPLMPKSDSTLTTNGTVLTMSQ